MEGGATRAEGAQRGSCWPRHALAFSLAWVRARAQARRQAAQRRVAASRRAAALALA